MIEVDRWEVGNIVNAMRGMRNPLNSWVKNDTHNRIIGENDLQLAQKLVKAGTDHSKFMRMITVSMDITAPLYWWKEFDTYKVGTVANSCSTMHTLTNRPLELTDFSFEHLSKIETKFMKEFVGIMNTNIKYYKRSNNKEYWHKVIQMLPSSFNQKRTVLLNYQVLRNMYFARRNHKLDEWVNFCKEIEHLPYAKELICLESEVEK